MKIDEFPPSKLRNGVGVISGIMDDDDVVNVLEGEVVTEEDSDASDIKDDKDDEDEDEEDDEEDSVEQDLTDALNLLEDAYNTIDLILDGKSYPTVYNILRGHPYLYEEFNRVSNDILQLTCQYTDVGSEENVKNTADVTDGLEEMLGT